MNWAEAGGTAADFEAGDYAAVFLLAFFSFKSVDIKHVLISSFIAGRVAVVGIGSASGLNRFL